MIDWILKTAQTLTARGFKEADRIAILSQSRIEAVVFTLACWKIGAVVVPLSTRYPTQKLHHALDSIQCKDVFTSRDMKADIPGVRVHELEAFVSVNAHETTPVTFDQLCLNPACDAGILFTSGSSGLPKGVLHTIGNHYHNASGLLADSPFEQGDRWLMSLPMYHISGFSLIMRSLIGGGILVIPKADQSVADAFITGKITHISVVPAQLAQWLTIPQAVKALRCCKLVLLGGSAWSQSLVKETLERGIPLHTTYGSTEAASGVTAAAPLMLTQNPSTCGKVLPYRELAIADDGEILLKGPALFKGYISPNGLEQPFDLQGYFHTGDIGTLDKDGLLTVIGRKDRMFISGGENIYPEEIEKLLLQIDSVEQAFVVPVSDSVMGRRPVAFIKQIRKNSEIDSDMITVQLEHHLERFKIPVAFLPWPDTGSDALKPDAAFFQSIAREAIKSDLDL